MKRSLAILSLFLVPIIISACGSSKPAATPVPAATNVSVMADTVMGSTNVPDAQTTERSCVMTNRFPKNSQIVWRVRIMDPVTGDLMDDKAVSKVQTKLANGMTLDLKYAAHPKTSQNFFWTVSWIVPLNQPTGTLGWSILATTGDGRTGAFQEIKSATSLMTITDEIFAPKQG
jgi:hypothetical protein